MAKRCHVNVGGCLSQKKNKQNNLLDLSLLELKVVKHNLCVKHSSTSAVKLKRKNIVC